MIKYVKGDATEPIGDGVKIIVHVCNNIGGWGAGFVLALSKKWKQPEKLYRSMKKRYLGDIQLVWVEKDIYVANMIAQEGTISHPTGPILPPIRYVAVELALKAVAVYAKEYKASIHMPRIGCGLAGGKWSIIEAVIKSTVPDDIQVIVYDFE